MRVTGLRDTTRRTLNTLLLAWALHAACCGASAPERRGYAVQRLLLVAKALQSHTPGADMTSRAASRCAIAARPAPVHRFIRFAGATPERIRWEAR